MINNNSQLTDISAWNADKSGLFDSKLELFNKLNPDIQCNDWICDDWTFDFRDNKWDLYFIKWDRAEKGKLFYKVVGKWEPFIEPGVLDEGKEIERVDKVVIRGVDVKKWNQNDETFKFSSSCFSKCSLKRHEALVMCYGNFEHFPKDCVDIDVEIFKDLMDKTHKLLLEKCNSLIQTATRKRFKRGWVFYKMREDYPAIDKLWKPHGFYYEILIDVAHYYSYKHKSVHPEDIKRQKGY